MFERLFAEIDIDDGNADLGQLFLIPGLIRGLLGLKVHDHDIGVQRNGLFDVECALLEAAKGRDVLHLRKFCGIGGIAFGRGLLKIIAPADDTGERIFAIQNCGKENLPALTQNNAVNRCL